ncbi:YfbM family protein [Zavarzinella formosa]|uniref:YfbM family protein n=1 Tax=Zavarzinella formosa TaxID=360055 RepID=UPI0002FB215C|nr:YfbM family protein [Zavarzinella formosa]
MGMICSLLAIPEPTAREVMANPAGIRALLAARTDPGRRLSLEKSWHGLHFALTGSAYKGDESLNFLVSGGEPIGNEDVGYGPARVLFTDGVARLNQALAAVDDESFQRRFNTPALEAANIYPQIWDEPLEELLEEYGGYFQELKEFIRQAAKDRLSLVVTIR